MGIKKLMDNHNRKLILSEVICRVGVGCTAYELFKDCNFGMSISAISQHLKKLEGELFINGEVCDSIIREGRYKKTYKITENGKKKIFDCIEDDIVLLVANMPIEDRIVFYERIREVLGVNEVIDDGRS